MTDLQQRLSDLAEWAADCGWHNHRKTALDARAAIARADQAEAEAERLESALRIIAEEGSGWGASVAWTALKGESND